MHILRKSWMVGIWNADMDLHLVAEVWIWILDFGHGIRTWDLEKDQIRGLDLKLDLNS